MTLNIVFISMFVHKYIGFITSRQTLYMTHYRQSCALEFITLLSINSKNILQSDQIVISKDKYIETCLDTSIFSLPYKN